ncbi:MULTISPECIES: IS630 family transposase [Francisella]|uniref:IS630 family transposase n=1 Tax=Francisella TaxID=262 RepID=UPI001E51243F|nr:MULTISPECIES: IS630 family transposase [Francisella]
MWVQDESRVGQQGSLTRIWAPTGTRPRKVKQGQFISTYIYGAACAKSRDSFGLILPTANTIAMQTYLNQLSNHIAAGRHIALVVDNAGWHTSKQLDIPKNITLIPLPPYSPELNPMEQVWEWMKNNYLSNICFDSYNDILEKLTIAWNHFSSNAELVKSICSRKWMFT